MKADLNKSQRSPMECRKRLEEAKKGSEKSMAIDDKEAGYISRNYTSHDNW